MKQEQIIKLAREAGFWDERDAAKYERFAELVAAHEREECAKVCEAISDEYGEREGGLYPEMKNDAETGARDCMVAIRDRGNKEAA